MGPRIFKKIVTADGQGSACDILVQCSGLSKSRIKRAMNQGAVWLQRKGGKERRIRRAAFQVQGGDGLTLYYDETILALKPPLSHCAKDYARYSIWFKPGGLMTQGTRYGDHCALTRQVEIHFKSRRKVYVVHRLDRETAGLVILAHDPPAASRLSALFQKRKIAKHYRAWVRGDVSRYALAGEIKLPLEGRDARTCFHFVQYEKKLDQSLIDIELITGRMHQIRRHLEMIGYPVMGDPRYGKGNKNRSGLQLAATRLQFECPFGNGHIDQAVDPERLGLLLPSA